MNKEAIPTVEEGLAVTATSRLFRVPEAARALSLPITGKSEHYRKRNFTILDEAEDGKLWVSF